MKIQDVFNTYQECVLPTYSKIPVVFVKGKGSYLWDIHGRKYLDFFPGWGVGSLGHCHPKVMQAVREQVAKLIFVPNNFYNLPQAKLAKELVRVSFDAKIFFSNSGAEANEAAIKLARKFGNGRYEIITFKDSFHGRTLGALAATGQEKYHRGFQPLPLGFKYVDFNDLDGVEAAITDKTVAIMLELVQGEGGVNLADKDFVAALRKICDQRKMLLIIDEVQTGFGRTGKMFAYEHFSFTPDIMTLAKALGGGLPIGAMVVKKDFSDTLSIGMHASTFGGSPLVSMAALAVIKAIGTEKLLENTRQMSRYLFSCLDSLKAKHPLIKQVRGLGLMAGVELSIEGKRIVEECFNRRLLINCTHDKVLRLMPALNVNKKEIDQAVRVLDEVLSHTGSQIDR